MPSGAAGLADVIGGRPVLARGLATSAAVYPVIGCQQMDGWKNNAQVSGTLYVTKQVQKLKDLDPSPRWTSSTNWWRTILVLS